MQSSNIFIFPLFVSELSNSLTAEIGTLLELH